LLFIFSVVSNFGPDGYSIQESQLAVSFFLQGEMVRPNTKEIYK